MPVNLYNITGRSSGEEISSTGEGRHLTFEESVLNHPTHTDGFVEAGDPVVIGENIIGVAFDEAAAATDLIAIDTEGIWALTCTATDEDGNSAIAVGDELYINKTTAIISKNPNKNTHAFFGYALTALATGTTDVVAVKVHWDPDDAEELVGTAAAPYALAAANNGREYRYRSTATQGDIRGMYMALGLNGVGGAGEAVRARTIVEAVGVAGGVHGLHGGLEFDADGELTGLGVGVRATFMAPNRSHAGGTISGGMSELWAEGASTDYTAFTMHSIHRFANSGEATGRGTADNVFEFVDLTTDQYEGNTDTPTQALRVIINGNVRYIMVSEAQA
jgi:hypothetical protein